MDTERQCQTWTDKERDRHRRYKQTDRQTDRQSEWNKDGHSATKTKTDME